tara:strand:+ start:1133 stop:2269 length:1137 start_codon:yes stop_codon:yes gene_type:complete
MTIKNYGTQIRKSPFYNSTINSGVKGFSVYNHMYIPRDFGDPEENFWNLINDAILCDVSVERQVEIRGKDAEKFVNYLTPRDISKCKDGFGKYILIVDNNGGILNDPIMFKHSRERFWLSLADSDILLWAKGVAVNSKMDVQIFEPDVSPLQLQGPKSKIIVKKVFGEEFSNLKYYQFKKCIYKDIPLYISRTGWSSELGFEIFLCDKNKGKKLWDEILSIGQPFGLKVGHTSTIRRIEGGMLSYHADMNIDNNPYELGLERLINLEKENDFIGKNSLKKIKKNGTEFLQTGIFIKSKPMKNPNTDFLEIFYQNKVIGKVTSAVFSPRIKKNIGLSLLKKKYIILGKKYNVKIDNKFFECEVTNIPFYDPEKKITKQN